VQYTSSTSAGMYWECSAVSQQACFHQIVLCQQDWGCCATLQARWRTGGHA
jgi:hypothetical protein